MKYQETTLALILIVVLSFQVQENVAYGILRFPRFSNPKPTNNPNRILAEVKSDHDSTDNPLVIIDFHEKTIGWPTAKDKPINLTPPQRITTKYSFSLNNDTEQINWKVFGSNGSTVIDQDIPVDPSYWPYIQFFCFISERLNCGFFVFVNSIQNQSIYQMLLCFFDTTPSMFINLTAPGQYENSKLGALTTKWSGEVSSNEKYSITSNMTLRDELVIFDEEAILTNEWGELRFYYRFSIEHGLEYIASRAIYFSEELWNTQTKQIFIVKQTSVNAYNYNLSREIVETNVSFSEEQLFNMLSKHLSTSFPPFQYLMIVLPLIILFRRKVL